MSDTESETETETAAETLTCLYPGCGRDAVPAPKFGGPPPRYCDDEGHNAGSTFQALQANKEDGAADEG